MNPPNTYTYPEDDMAAPRPDVPAGSAIVEVHAPPRPPLDMGLEYVAADGAAVKEPGMKERVKVRVTVRGGVSVREADGVLVAVSVRENVRVREPVCVMVNELVLVRVAVGDPLVLEVEHPARAPNAIVAATAPIARMRLRPLAVWLMGGTLPGGARKVHREGRDAAQAGDGLRH